MQVRLADGKSIPNSALIISHNGTLISYGTLMIKLIKIQFSIGLRRWSDKTLVYLISLNTCDSPNQKLPYIFNDFAISAAMAWVLLPFCRLSSSMACARVNPICIISLTSVSEKWSWKDTPSTAEATGAAGVFSGDGDATWVELDESCGCAVKKNPRYKWSTKADTQFHSTGIKQYAN